MFERKVRLVIVSAVVLLLCVRGQAVLAKTWRLEKGEAWKELSGQEQDKYLLAVAEIKRLVNSGQCVDVEQKLQELKEAFPEIAGRDLDAFMAAEVLFCEGKFADAVLGYRKFLAEFRESELFDAALEREFAIGTAFLGGEKKQILKFFKIRGYAEGVRIMERIIDRTGLDSPMGLKAAIAIAESYEERELFDDAYLMWDSILQQWETGEMGEKASLGKARCKHAAYRGPKYDVSNLISAETHYENFSLKYTTDAQKLGVDKILEQINEQRAYKQFSIGRYYQRTDSQASAIFYYEMVLNNWPNTKAAEMAEQMLGDLRIKKVKK
ncbi:MAG: outer membrane protein assembly factor BamD [Planctomycetota bacterium]